MMFGILGEDRSDVEMLTVLLRRLKNNDRLPVKSKGFGSGSELLRKGLIHLSLLQDLGCQRFLICHDADGPDPKPTRDLITQKIITPSGLDAICAVVPVQEIEAWILADIPAVTRIFTSWKPKPIPNPEGTESPKEYLIKLSRTKKARPRYDHVIHNAKVAKYVDLDVVARKCLSFREFVAFVDS